MPRNKTAASEKLQGIGVICSQHQFSLIMWQPYPALVAHVKHCSNLASVDNGAKAEQDDPTSTPCCLEMNPTFMATPSL